MTTLRMGSRGDDVRALQEKLNLSGYGLDVDGAFGAKTLSAVRDYQSKNGLDADGVVGAQTWSSLLRGGESAEAGEAGGAPEWRSPYGAALDKLYEDIAAGGAFSYDPGSDALYRRYRAQYERLGRQAMDDTLGKAAALTGGYGSSYAENAAQQAYHGWLDKLPDAAADLYQQAYRRYRDGRDDLTARYKLLSEREQQAYRQYQDARRQYDADRAAEAAAAGGGSSKSSSKSSSSKSGSSGSGSGGKESPGVTAALAFLQRYPGAPWNSRTADNYIRSLGLTAQEKADFRAYLKTAAPDAGFAR